MTNLQTGRLFWVTVPALLFTAALAIAWSGSDVPLFLAIHHAAAAAGATFWQNVTLFGYGAVALALASAWLADHPRSAWAGLLGAIPAGLIVRGFKATVALPRPLAVLGTDVTPLGPPYAHTSFPSGDAMTIFLLAGVACWTYQDRRVRGLVLAGAALVALSRVAIGVHWPSDVLAGAAAGWVCAYLGVRWSGRWPVQSRAWILPLAAAIFLGASVHLALTQVRLPLADIAREAIAALGIACSAAALWRLPMALPARRGLARLASRLPLRRKQPT